MGYVLSVSCMVLIISRKRLIDMRKVPFTGLCCVLLSFCLVSCGKNTSTMAIQMDLVDSFFKAKEDVVICSES